MADTLLHGLALIAAVCGMAWLALAKPLHFQQAVGDAAASARTVRGLNAGGAAALSLSLLLCLTADHLSMAFLVWSMLMTAAALLVAFALAFRPRWIGRLLPAHERP